MDIARDLRALAEGPIADPQRFGHALRAGTCLGVDVPAPKIEPHHVSAWAASILEETRRALREVEESERAWWNPEVVGARDRDVLGRAVAARARLQGLLAVGKARFTDIDLRDPSHAAKNLDRRLECILAPVVESVGDALDLAVRMPLGDEELAIEDLLVVAEAEDRWWSLLVEAASLRAQATPAAYERLGPTARLSLQARVPLPPPLDALDTWAPALMAALMPSGPDALDAHLGRFLESLAERRFAVEQRMQWSGVGFSRDPSAPPAAPDRAGRAASRLADEIDHMSIDVRRATRLCRSRWEDVAAVVPFDPRGLVADLRGWISDARAALEPDLPARRGSYDDLIVALVEAAMREPLGAAITPMLDRLREGCATPRARRHLRDELGWQLVARCLAVVAAAGRSEEEAREEARRLTAIAHGHERAIAALSTAGDAVASALQVALHALLRVASAAPGPALDEPQPATSPVEPTAGSDVSVPSFAALSPTDVVRWALPTGPNVLAMRRSVERVALAGKKELPPTVLLGPPLRGPWEARGIEVRLEEAKAGGLLQIQVDIDADSEMRLDAADAVVVGQVGADGCHSRVELLGEVRGPTRWLGRVLVRGPIIIQILGAHSVPVFVTTP